VKPSRAASGEVITPDTLKKTVADDNASQDGSDAERPSPCNLTPLGYSFDTGG